jgi:lipid II:glycine glycyltransferase (peptidoglycan interpeptide bridge formation enzyme)
MKHTEKHDIKISSCSYEENIVDDFAVKEVNDYITKIMIDVE